MFDIGKKLVVAFISLFSYLIFEPLIESATFFCQDPQDSTLYSVCQHMPSIEFADPSELSQFRKIRELLRNHQYLAWVRADGK